AQVEDQADPGLEVAELRVAPVLQGGPDGRRVPVGGLADLLRVLLAVAGRRVVQRDVGHRQRDGGAGGRRAGAGRGGGRRRGAGAGGGGGRGGGAGAPARARQGAAQQGGRRGRAGPAEDPDHPPEPPAAAGRLGGVPLVGRQVGHERLRLHFAVPPGQRVGQR